MHPATAALNHLLSQNPSARKRLAPFAGLCFAVDPFPLPRLAFIVTPEGGVAEPGGQAPDAVLAATPDALLRYLLVSPHDLSAIRIHGYHPFGEVVAQVLAGLEWDAEEDLSHFFGDVLAHRLVAFGRAWWRWRLDSVLRLGEALTEYLTEEQPILAKGADLARFRAEVEALAARLEALESRIAHLPGRG